MALNKHTVGSRHSSGNPVVAGDVCNTAASCSAANSVANNVANVYLGGGGAIGAGFHFDASKTATSSSNMVYQAYSSNTCLHNLF